MLNRRQTTSGRKVSGRRKKERKIIMPSLVATTSTLARKPCVRTHYVRTNGLFYLKQGSILLPLITCKMLPLAFHKLPDCNVINVLKLVHIFINTKLYKSKWDSSKETSLPNTFFVKAKSQLFWCCSSSKQHLINN